MKRRKNAVYKGQSKRARNITRNMLNPVYRVLVDAFYEKLNGYLLPEDEIEIIPPKQVNPTHSVQEQEYIVADYCVRKILPEVTSLFHWGDEVTPQLRALAPIVDRETAQAANRAVAVVYEVAVDLAATRDAAAFDAADDFGYPAFDAVNTAYGVVIDLAGPAYSAAYTVYAAAGKAADVARCVYRALVACIEADDEATYNRIIALTNEMLESL